MIPTRNGMLNTSNSFCFLLIKNEHNKHFKFHRISGPYNMH
jgi:hypothetical protein